MENLSVLEKKEAEELEGLESLDAEELKSLEDDFLKSQQGDFVEIQADPVNQEEILENQLNFSKHHQKSQLLEQIYYYLKIKFSYEKSKIFLCALLGIEISGGFDSQEFSVVFINQPKVIFTNYESIYERFDIKGSVKEFLREMELLYTPTIKNHFFIYNNFIKNLKKSFYAKKIELKKDYSSINDVLKDVINELNSFLQNHWSLTGITIEIEPEKVNKTFFGKKEGNMEKIASVSEEETKAKEIKWEVPADVEIKKYFPVIAPVDGKLALDFKVGDKVFVTPNEKNEEFVYPYRYTKSKLQLSKIVEIKKDADDILHFLVEIDPKQFADIEIYDEFFKIKTFDEDQLKLNQKKKKEQRKGNFRVVLNFCFVFLSIIVIYSFLVASISLIF